MCIKVSSENVKTERHLENKCAYQSTILSRSSKLGCKVCRLHLSESGHGPRARFCVYGEVLPCPIKGGEFLNDTSGYKLLKNCCST